jgi:hypothetical protein
VRLANAFLSQQHLLVNSCNDEGAPNICKKDQETDHRLYEIQVTATDQAGNEGTATCEVIIYSDTSSPKVCQNFAVHARDKVTFDGVRTTIDGGDVGVSSGTAITGTYQVDNGEVVNDSSAFAASVLVAHTEAMEVRTEGIAMAIEIGGKIFTPGTYRSDSAINFAAGIVTLDGLGEANPEFLFQALSTLVTAANTKFNLINGAKAENVIWALGTAATLGANSVLEGSILAGSAITFGAKSELHGCALAKTAVTFESEGSVIAHAPVSLDEVADEVIESVRESTQRYEVASLALEWSVLKWSEMTTSS